MLSYQTLQLNSTVICTEKKNKMIYEKYKPLFMSHQFGGIRTMNMHKRWLQFLSQPSYDSTNPNSKKNY
jgi:hypothetical protein